MCHHRLVVQYIALQRKKTKIKINEKRYSKHIHFVFTILVKTVDTVVLYRGNNTVFTKPLILLKQNQVLWAFRIVRTHIRPPN